MEKLLQPIVGFLENKDWSEYESDFALIQYDIVDILEQHKIGFEAIQPIIELMERYPLVEFGTPGPLTHFIEKFYLEKSNFYEKSLVESLYKQPTVHTIWLLNRVINGARNENSKELIQILKSISDNKSLHQDIQRVAANFFSYHCES